jgi:hypothetical protein
MTPVLSSIIQLTLEGYFSAFMMIDSERTLPVPHNWLSIYLLVHPYHFPFVDFHVTYPQDALIFRTELKWNEDFLHSSGTLKLVSISPSLILIVFVERVNRKSKFSWCFKVNWMTVTIALMVFLGFCGGTGVWTQGILPLEPLCQPYNITNSYRIETTQEILMVKTCNINVFIRINYIKFYWLCLHL